MRDFVMTGRGYQQCGTEGEWEGEAPFCTPADARRHFARQQAAIIDLDPTQGQLKVMLILLAEYIMYLTD